MQEREKIDGAGVREKMVQEREDRRCRRERIDGAGELGLTLQERG